MNRLEKIARALSTIGFWPALARGVVPGLEHRSAFRCRKFATVLDVGANEGQFASFAVHQWPEARLICFEPLKVPRDKLSTLMSTRAEILPYALGNRNGLADMHIASREDSSSLLSLGEAQKRIFCMEEFGVLTVPVRRIDDVIDVKQLEMPVLLKLDVQGFEYEALQGGAGLLAVVDAVYVECSFIELYDNQKLATQVVELLSGFGLNEVGRFNICERGSQIIQADILFAREAPQGMQ